MENKAMTKKAPADLQLEWRPTPKWSWVLCSNGRAFKMFHDHEGAMAWLKRNGYEFSAA